MAGDKAKALEAGCDDYHPKPVDFSRLLSQIEEVLLGAEDKAADEAGSGLRAAAARRHMGRSGQNSAISGTPTRHDDDRERQPELPVVAEAVSARPHDQRVALVPDGREEVAGGADGHGHEEGVRVQSELLRQGCRRWAPASARWPRCSGRA
jgi:hypothetical protein